MSIVYLDTSAALKLLVQEPESTAMEQYVSRESDQLVSSMLLFTELHCVAHRRGGVDLSSVNVLLGGVELVKLVDEDLRTAGLSAWGLRSADAIHLAAAVRIEVDAVLTYDAEMGEAAERLGMTWLRVK